MAKLDAFRKLIREEVRAVFQEELSSILKEAIISNKGGNTVINEARSTVNTTVPLTLNTQQSHKRVAPNLGFNNPLNSLLQETAQSMTDKDLEGLGLEGASYETPIVESVNGMFDTARKAGSLEAVEINAVPDFSHIMNKMLSTGEIR
jgi:hypothetical protein